MKETFFEIGNDIKEHIDEERRRIPVPSVGIARYRVDYQGSPFKQIYLTNGNIPSKSPYRNNAIDISKNSKLGGYLIDNGIGKGIFESPDGKKHFDIEIFSKTTYQPYSSGSAKDIQVWESNVKSYKFNSLRELLALHDVHKKQFEDNRKKQLKLEEEKSRLLAEQKIKEEEARKAEEKRLREEAEREAARLAEQLRIQEEEEKKNLEEAQRLQAELIAEQENISYLQSFVRRGKSLRSQHILDKSQEKAKRDCIFKGIPVLIDGGPGTGKTTTMIQRLKFLLAPEALKDYTDLPDAEIEALTDPNVVNSNWMFFSPNKLLLQYLRENMSEEGLKANSENTFTIDRYRMNMFTDVYHLHNHDTDGPFKQYKFGRRETPVPLIIDPYNAVQDFEFFCANKLKRTLLEASKLNTADFDWHKDAIYIKADCKKAEDCFGLIKLIDVFKDLHNHHEEHVKDIEKKLSKLVDITAAGILRKVKDSEEKWKQIESLFASWQNSTISDEELAEDEVEDIDEETLTLSMEQELYKKIKSMLKKYGVSLISSKKRPTAKEKSLYDIVKDYVIKDDIKKIGNLAWFSTNYSGLTKGVYSNLLSKIPRFYKEYRKYVLETKANTYNLTLLSTLISKDKNKHLHDDEINMLIGFINNQCIKLHSRLNSEFDKLKGVYIDAYKESCKPVIGVDEATDYSMLDYYFIYSFRHYKRNSVTLCGDIMQGLNENGIKNWDCLKELAMPNLKTYELKVSYRQTPTLLNIAREMYKADTGRYPSYQSDKKQDSCEPKPIALISEEENEKLEWISGRIKEVWNTFGKQMPSVAIFVGDDVNVDEFIEDLEYTGLNGIEIANCTENTDSADAIRVFKLSQVKGMEFEVVFFHNIDEVLINSNESIMTRYLYVGISRATTHLAATFCNKESAGSALKYFDTENNTWPINGKR